MVRNAARTAKRGIARTLRAILRRSQGQAVARITRSMRDPPGKSKSFFFAKKKQKTFANKPIFKSLLVLFFRKEHLP
jgi:hypothetical protein